MGKEKKDSGKVLESCNYLFFLRRGMSEGEDCVIACSNNKIPFLGCGSGCWMTADGFSTFDVEPIAFF